MTHCKLTRNTLTLNTKGNISHCCIQHTDQTLDIDWDKVDDLNEWYANQPWLTKVREDLDAGIQNEACRTCWKFEGNNQSSKRLTANRIHADVQDVDITHVDLRLSNKCNLQCKMCHPASSDQIDAVVRTLHERGIPTAQYESQPHDLNIERLIDLIVKLPNLQWIRLAGGEPFIMPEVEHMITRLIELGKTDITMEFLTNGTSLKGRILDMLGQFKKANLIFSIDGIGDNIEYQRFPVKWKTVEKNFIRAYESPCHVAIAPVMTMFNFGEIDQFLEWTKQYPDVYVGYSEVLYPSTMNFRYIPLEYRQPLWDSLKDFELGPKHHPNWKHFIDAGMYETKEMNDVDRTSLNKSVNWWDFKCKERFVDRYPWGQALLDGD